MASIQLIYAFLALQTLGNMVLLKMVVVTPMIKHCVHRNVQMMANHQINVVQILKRRFFISIFIFCSYPRVQKYLKTSQPLPNVWHEGHEDPQTWGGTVKKFIRPDGLASGFHAPLFLFKTMSSKKNFSYWLPAQIFYTFISPKCAVLWPDNSIVFDMLIFGEAY
jgi:hypothetical protein